MAAHFRIDVDPLGDGEILVNGDNVTPHIAAAQLTVQPGQPTTLTLHTHGDAIVEGHGVVHVVSEADAASVAAEVAELLDGLDGATMWEAMMNDPTVDLSDPAGAFLAYVAEIITGTS